MKFGEIDGFWFKDEPQAAPIEINITIEDILGNSETYSKVFQESEIVQDVEYIL